MFRRLAAEFIGTFWLVFGGTGAAVLAAAFPDVGIGLLGVAFAFGLTLMTAAYAIGRISGCHINPAVTIGFATAGKFPWKDVVPYIIAQVLGAIAGSGIVYAIASGGPDFDIGGGLAANGYGAHSPGNYSMVSGMIAEIVLTFIFVFVILGTIESRLTEGFAPIAIGLCLTAVHLAGIPVTNMSVNPARSTGPAVFVGDWALAQLWLFWVFPILGAVIAGLLHRVMGPDQGMTQASETR